MVVYTRGGCKVRIICQDRKSPTHPIVGLVGFGDQVQCYTLEGFVHGPQWPCAMDLILQSEPLRA